jgi:phosphoglycolate phosphatase
VQARLIVFDLDGTLIVSRRDLADATNALLAGLGAPPLDLEAVAAMVGDGAALLVRRALAASGLDPDTPQALARFLALYDERLTVHTRPYAGVPEMLERLRRTHALAVLTNKPTRATTRILGAFGMASAFHAVVGGDTPHGRKPAPDGLLHLATAAGAPPASTLLVGDSPVDLATARNARTLICLARYGFGYACEEGATASAGVFTIDTPLGLVELLQER